MSSSAPVVIDIDSSDDEENNEFTPTLLGSTENQVVGIRSYTGVAHPGEFVRLVREPNNVYDRNAIRVDNLRGEKVGHVKAAMAKMLAPLMDGSARLGVRVEGTIPRGGNSFSVSHFLFILYYFVID
jgi:SWI/SNF-related matrix-associated actin-dependent regulator of chromatin subfamily A3